jgi:hypothetical protein
MKAYREIEYVVEHSPSEWSRFRLDLDHREVHVVSSVYGSFHLSFPQTDSDTFKAMVATISKDELSFGKIAPPSFLDSLDQFYKDHFVPFQQLVGEEVASF